MKIEEKLIERFDSLILLGQKVLSAKSYNEFGDKELDQELATQWLLSLENLTEKVLENSKVYSKRIENIVGPHTYLSYEQVLQLLGVLRSAKEDYELGMMMDFKKFIEAEIFDDFLEQAQY